MIFMNNHAFKLPPMFPPKLPPMHYREEIQKIKARKVKKLK